MKGFDDHLDNYGDPNPDDDSLYPECEHTPPCTGDREDAPCYRKYDEPPPFDENHYRFHTPAGPNPTCVSCRWLNWQQDDLPAPSFTISDDALYDALTADDGITSDDFDNWPGEREFPS